MSTSRVLDVARVASLRPRSQRGLRIDLKTTFSGTELVRGQFDEGPLKGVVRNSGRIRDLVNTYWPGIFLISDQFRMLLQEHRLAGWRTVAVTIRGGEQQAAPLWLLAITGSCGRLYGVGGDPVPHLSSIGDFLDPHAWDGSDFFLAENHDGILLTASCAEILKNSTLTNLEIEPARLEPLPAAL